MKKAFTLAETLIVIAIIGVIATLTLPNVMANYKKKVYVAQLQKVYNQIENAMQQFLVDENAEKMNETYLGNDDEWEDEINNVIKFLKKYFKTTKICRYNETDQCISTYKNFDGDNTITLHYDACAVLNTGSVICINSWQADEAHPYLDVVVDVNGMNGPNHSGRDVFYMQVYSNYIRSRVRDNGNGELLGCDRGRADGYADGCLGRIQAAGWKMDY